MREDLGRSLDPELWHACAGGTVQIPSVNTEVFYFPQGHAEHTLRYVDFGNLPKIPAMILCRVEDVKYLADLETDEVYAKIHLVPCGKNEVGFEDDRLVRPASGYVEKPTSFAKTLTQSDANNGGGFSVPRYCAETIFPRLDYTADPPVQNIVAKDVHGETWKFRHIFRGTPRRHLLTTGWSTFVNQKKLIAGDSIVFMRAENGDLWIGIGRAKKKMDIRTSASFGSFLMEDSSKLVKPESVVQAAYLAATAQPFEVEFLPRVNTPEFCVRSSSILAAMRIQWCPGIRFKMPFETEYSSRISWFTGTVASVQVNDQLQWRNSPWRSLQVNWDEPDLLQNVKYVNPWLVEIVSGIPVSSISQPQKKFRSHHNSDYPFDCQFPLPIDLKGPSFLLQDTISAGIQGARHASNLNLCSELKLGLPPSSFYHVNPHLKVHDETYESVSCLLSIGSLSQKPEKIDDTKIAHFVLFGQPIFTEQQISGNHSKSSIGNRKSSSVSACDSGELTKSLSTSEFTYKDGDGLDTIHYKCKVLIDSEDIAHSLDLSIIGSFEELYRKLEDIVGSDVKGNVLYHDATGVVKPIGDEPEPFSNFAKQAERLIIHTKQKVERTERKLITGLAVGARGLNSSNQAGTLSIFA